MVRKRKNWTPYDNKRVFGDNFFMGYCYCPICGRKGELFEGIEILSVTEEWTEEMPVICPKCKNELGLPLIIGFVGVKRGNRADFFNELIEAMEEKAKQKKKIKKKRT